MSSREFTSEAFSVVVRKWCVKHHGGLNAAGYALGITKGYISRCCAGHRRHHDNLMEAMGYGVKSEKVHTYFKKEEEQEL